MGRNGNPTLGQVQFLVTHKTYANSHQLGWVDDKAQYLRQFPSAGIDNDKA